jgi:hypothetical protein
MSYINKCNVIDEVTEDGGMRRNSRGKGEIPEGRGG